MLDNLPYSFLYKPHHKRSGSGNSAQISNLLVLTTGIAVPITLER